MAAAALLSVTLVPALMVIFVRGRIVPEHRNPINRFLIWVYRPVIRGVLRAKTLTILIALVALGASVWPAMRIGSEDRKRGVTGKGCASECRSRGSRDT